MLYNPITSSADENYLGYFTNEAALILAYPTADAGNFVTLGSTDTVWIWDGDTNAWVDSLASAGTGDMLKADNLSGLANYTTARSNLGLGSAAVSNTADFAPALGVDDNYVTDAEKTKLANTSNTNSGDETEATLLSKLTVFADSKNDTGFYDNTNISVAYDKTTRTVTLTRAGGVIYYFQGKKYTLTSPWTSPAHVNAAGTYFLESADGVTFTFGTTPFNYANIMVALAIYDGADGWVIRECHGLMDIESHKSAHNNIGTWRSSGGLLTAGTYTENTASDAANSPGFDSAVVNDEDIATTIPAWTEGTYTTMYIGASSTATFSTVATLPFTSAGSYIQVNNTTTGALTDGATGRYYNVYQILVPAGSDTDSQKRRMIMLQPQATHTTRAAAQAEDPRTLSLGDFQTKATEFTIYARITYVTSAGDGNTGKCRIATGGVSYIIGNRLSSSSATGTVGNHAGLTNLSWASSAHTGTANTLPVFDASGLPTLLAPTAGQSVRMNAGGTALEAYTPSSGGGSQTEPLQDYQGPAIIGVLGTYVFDSSKTGSKYSITVDSIPVGSNLIVELRKNSYTSGNVLSSTLQIATSDTLTNGKKTVSITDTDSYVAGDYVVAYLTSVGSTTPALNPYFTLTIS